MAFSFNWAGVTVPQAQKAADRTQMTLDLGKDLGSAVRGYKVDQANKEYASMLDEYGTSGNRIAEIEKQIAELEAANAELMQRKQALVG